MILAVIGEKSVKLRLSFFILLVFFSRTHVNMIFRYRNSGLRLSCKQKAVFLTSSNLKYCDHGIAPAPQNYVTSP